MRIRNWTSAVRVPLSPGACSNIHSPELCLKAEEEPTDDSHQHTQCIRGCELWVLVKIPQLTTDKIGLILGANWFCHILRQKRLRKFFLIEEIP